MKSKKKKQNKKTTQKLFEVVTELQKSKDEVYDIVCPYATETTTMSYNKIQWSR